ncbi:hypothetical protein K437DRAFT_255483 [Tilletiaria anomala UBC 951]|uniref:Uncharacterized protein n=1 Tax=Tilletiaria anomala (strain ATCC 24038 / CBS 436.72 / UBC 951) TaxID=1037660 RepID=A0A066WBN8_TILAU|nr:uncharacterized protein K437DRAFT_255483 [Tilletiaria anomala UBC 951]KDN48509.1 hypothetical protein K437DRAFT_255483 [Tilletiaria anomala UBC 951]
MLSRSVLSGASAARRHVLQQQARFASSGSAGSAAPSLPIPPKVATPQSVKGPGGSSARMDAVVNFYKSLPKGQASVRRGGGIKARYFDGKNASGAPIVATMFGLFLLGYTIDYNMHLKHHKNAHH